jgi:hypothetical protein
MDKTKQRMRKIVTMMKHARVRVAEAAYVCALWSTPALALADEAKAPEISGTGLGLGGAYLFGLAAGLIMFAVRYALDVRRSHLAEYGK